MYIIICETDHQSRFNACDRGAQGWCTGTTLKDGMGREEGVGFRIRTHVNPWLIHINVWIMYGCESWTIKKAEQRRIDAFELWCWRRLLRGPLDCKEKSVTLFSFIFIDKAQQVSLHSQRHRRLTSNGAFPPASPVEYF